MPTAHHRSPAADRARRLRTRRHDNGVDMGPAFRWLTELLGQLKFDDEVLEWVRSALQTSHADERRDHEHAIRRLQAEHKRIGDRINAMYLDKLDGRVDGAFFDKKMANATLLLLVLLSRRPSTLGR